MPSNLPLQFCESLDVSVGHIDAIGMYFGRLTAEGAMQSQNPAGAFQEVSPPVSLGIRRSFLKIFVGTPPGELYALVYDSPWPPECANRCKWRPRPKWPIASCNFSPTDCESLSRQNRISTSLGNRCGLVDGRQVGTSRGDDPVCQGCWKNEI